jgi:hypothetical protein
MPGAPCFSCEVSIMLKQLLGFSLSRYARAIVLLVTLGACNAGETGFAGYLEVLPRSQNEVCDAVAPGHLRLDGVVDAAGTVVSGEELCKGGVIRRELPAGLYSVSWQPNTGDDASESGERWALRGPTVVSVFPGQVTRLRVQQVTPDDELAVRMP